MANKAKMKCNCRCEKRQGWKEKNGQGLLGW